MPLWCCALLGLGFIIPGVVSLFGFTSSSGGDAWKTIAIGTALTGPLLYYWLRPYVARHITRGLLPEWQLRERLKADDRALNRVMSQTAVRPRAIVDGKRYYSLSDFGEIASLLRASSAPARTQATLLRPATGVETPAEQLLRPTKTMQQSSRLQESQQAAIRYDNMKQVEEIEINRPG